MSWAEIKHALNSTLGTDDFKPLDKMISGNIVIIKENTTWSIPKGIDVVYITACGGGGGGGISQLILTIGYCGTGCSYESHGNVP